MQLAEQSFLFHVLDAAASPGLMVDVGAHFGGSLAPFARAGWNVLAFEPDPENRRRLEAANGKNDNVEIVAAAVGDHEEDAVPIYASVESSGISSLCPFRDSHKEVARVQLVTVKAELEKRGIERVDLLKVDVEGFEMAVLRGTDFGRLKPRTVMVEYEDSKTKIHGYDAHDLAKSLVEKGYSVFVSEWWPIVRYGVRHSWRRLRPYPCAIPTEGWGNLIGFLEVPPKSTMISGLHASLTFTEDTPKLVDPVVVGGDAAPETGQPTNIEAPAVPSVDEAAMPFGLWLKAYLGRHVSVSVLAAVLVVALLAAPVFFPVWSWAFTVAAGAVAGVAALMIGLDFFGQGIRRTRIETASALAETTNRISAALAATWAETFGAIDSLRRNVEESETKLRDGVMAHLTARFGSLRKEVADRSLALVRTVADVQKDFDERIDGLASRITAVRKEIEATLASGLTESRVQLTEKTDALAHTITEARFEASREAVAQIEDLRGTALKRVTELEAELARTKIEAADQVHALEAGLQAAREELLGEIEGRHGAALEQFARQMESLRATAEMKEAALKAEVAKARSKTANDVVALRGEMRESERVLQEATAKQRAEVLRQVQSISELVTSVKSDHAVVRNSVERLGAEVSSQQASNVTALDLLKQSAEAIRLGVEQVTANSASVRADAERAVQQSKSAEDVATKVSAALETIQASTNNLDSLFRRMNNANFAVTNPHQRFLTTGDADRFAKNWAPKFNLSISPRAVSYLAHQVCRLENQIDGRLATTISAAVFRLLAMRSLTAERVAVLEIGTLFGVSAGMFARLGAPDGRKVHVTMIDPLSGYYQKTEGDPQTGIPVNRKTLEKNLRTLGLKSSDYRILEGFSQNPEIVETATSHHYDYVLIDGDHTYEGVARDFELYGKTVRPGGILVFDDYDTPEWPAIKSFVDEVMKKRTDWEFIGGEWRTGIFRARVAPTESEESPASDEAKA